MNTADKYYWIMHHPKFMTREVDVEIDITPHNVCPSTGRVEDYAPLNTRCDFWAELCAGMYEEDQGKYWSTHLVECDCGGKTYDEAVDNLYKKVIEHYGEYTEEEYDKKFDEVYGTENDAFFASLIAPSNPDEPSEFTQLEEYDAEHLQYHLDSIKIYQKALTEYLETCTIEERAGAEAELAKVNYEIYLNKKSLEWGIFFTK